MFRFGKPNIEKMVMKKDVKGLIKALNSDWNVRQEAADALGNIGDQRAVEPLIKAMNDSNNYDRVCRSAAEALGKVGWKPGKDESAIQYWILKDEWSRVVEIGEPAVELLIKNLCFSKAAWALGEIGDLRAIEPLINCLNSSKETIRTSASNALIKIGAQAVEYLINAMRDFNVSVRREAAWALGGIGDQRAIEPLIKALNNSDAEVQKTAAESLGKIGIPAVESLIQTLNHFDKSVQKTAVEALGKIRDQRAVEPLISVLICSVNIDREAAWALGEIGDQRAVEPLINKLKYSNEDFLQTAAEAFGKIGAPQAVGPLLEMLRDSRHSVRLSAARSLIKLYNNKKTDQIGKNKILNAKDLIEKPHGDGRQSSDCTDHYDNGIGLHFPI